VHYFRLVPGAGGQPAGLAKMRFRILRGPSRHLLYGVDRSHFAMCLQVLVQRARVPLRKQGDGCVDLHFPPDFGGAHRSAPRLHVGLFYVIFGTEHSPSFSKGEEKSNCGSIGDKGRSRRGDSIGKGCSKNSSFGFSAALSLAFFSSSF
jgi:hypothetical protein